MAKKKAAAKKKGSPKRKKGGVMGGLRTGSAPPDRMPDRVLKIRAFRPDEEG
jgi:hypothetical protein